MSLKEAATHIIEAFSSKSEEREYTSIIITTITYHIWKGRNSRVHNSKPSAKEKKWVLCETDSNIMFSRLKKRKRSKPGLFIYLNNGLLRPAISRFKDTFISWEHLIIQQIILASWFLKILKGTVIVGTWIYLK